jgi:PIN domain nuclease of toxin-antitoxin system
MDLLVDTDVFLWWDSRDTKLSAASQCVISDPQNRVFVSAATFWRYRQLSRQPIRRGGSPGA